MAYMTDTAAHSIAVAEDAHLTPPTPPEKNQAAEEEDKEEEEDQQDLLCHPNPPFPLSLVFFTAQCTLAVLNEVSCPQFLNSPVVKE